MRQLKAMRAADTNGITAEMLKEGGGTLRRVLIDAFNDILRPGSPMPTSWKLTAIKVLQKSSDTMRPDNYRPIASTPMLYKLFSELLCDRCGDALDCQRSSDQA
eukprot:3601502-Pyramimonas_sp.AAC.1